MKKGASSHFRAAVLFIAAAMVIQAVFTLFLTPQGLVRLYPYAVRLKSEKVESDASFAEYHTLRQEFADCTMFFLGADTTVADSYFVILDYLSFLKRNFEITTLAMDIGTITADNINACLAASDTAGFNEALGNLRKNGRFTVEFLNFVKGLYTFNQTMIPERRITVKSVFTESVQSATVSDMSSDILADWGNLNDEVRGIMSISDVDGFFEYMAAHSAAFTDYLGEDGYNAYMEIRAHHEAGDYDEWAIASKLTDLVSEHTLLIVDQNAVRPKSPLRTFVSELGVNASYVSIMYSGCHGIGPNGEKELNDISLPFASERSVRFVSREKLGGFLGYYRLITNPASSEKRREAGEYLDNLTTQDFFVVIGSDAVKYGDTTEAAQ